MSSIINIAANRIKQRFTSQLSITRPGSEMSINSTGSLRDSMRTEVSLCFILLAAMFIIELIKHL